MQRFEGQVALVTGAARGIGRGIVQRLAGEGAHVIINEKYHLDEAEALAQQIRAAGREAHVWTADVSDRAAIKAMFEQTVEEFGRIDVAVANAGVSIREPMVEAEWDHVMTTVGVTQLGVFHTCQFAAQQMVKQPIVHGRSRGKIIIISSVLSEYPFPKSSAYNMAKAAVGHLARTLANELAEHHINVNVINPGWINTPGERQHATEEEIAQGASQLPWGRLGEPDDIANAAAFLASDEADYITGATLRVDGGYLLGLQQPE
ncbi:MAG: glucose 1-dehydrogenase [Anaerolineae bacterium]|nr:glucose 1-dehydrogenase [Anaerolineae bacterium]